MARLGRRDRAFGSYSGTTDVSRSIDTGTSNFSTQALSSDSTVRFAQSFASLGDSIFNLTVSLSKTGSPTDNVVFELRTDSSGQPGTLLATANVDASTALTAGIPVPLNYSALTPGATYWIVAYRSGATDAANCRRLRFPFSAIDVYGGGRRCQSADSGGTWGTFDNQDYFFTWSQRVSTASYQQPFVGVRSPVVVGAAPLAPPVRTQLVALSAARRSPARRPTSALHPPGPSRVATDEFDYFRRGEPSRAFWYPGFTGADPRSLNHYRRGEATPVMYEGLPTVEPPVETQIKTELVAVSSRVSSQRKRQRTLALTPYESTVGQDFPADFAALGTTPLAMSASTDWFAERFSWGGGPIATVQLSARVVGSPTDDIIVSIQADDGTGDPDEVDIVSGRISTLNLTTINFRYRTVVGLEHANLAAGTYWIVARRSGITDAANRPELFGTSADGYSGGYRASSSNGGSTYTDSLGTDFVFKITRPLGIQGWLTPMFGPRPPRVIHAPPHAPPIKTKLVAVSSRVSSQRRRERHLGWTSQQGTTARSLRTASSTTLVDTLQNPVNLQAQSFIAIGTSLVGLQVGVSRQGNPTDNVIVEIQTDVGGQPSGVVLGSGSTPAAPIPTGHGFRNLQVNSGPLTPGQTYWFVLRRSGTNDPSNYIWVCVDNFDEDQYAGGYFAQSFDSGGSWTPYFLGFDLAAVLWFAEDTFPQRVPLIGPRPPQVVEERPFAPPIKTTRAAVAPSRLHPSRRPLSRLYAPTVVTTEAAQPPVETTIHTTLVAVSSRASSQRKRHRLSRLTAPILSEAVSFIAEPISVTLARVRPRPTQVDLRAPATLEPWSVALRERTIGVALARIRPRPTTKRLAAPATLEPWSVALQLRSITTHLAAQLRLARRPGRVRLNPPTVLQVFSGPAAKLVSQFRFSRARAAYPELRPPAVVEPSLVPGDPRLTLPTHLVRARPRPTQAVVLPPATLVAAGTPVEDQLALVTRWLVWTRPRPTAKFLRQPVVEPSLVPGDPRLEVRVTLAGRTRTEAQRRAPHYFRTQPATLEPWAVQLQQRTSHITLAVLARLARRPAYPELRPPVVVEPSLLGSDPRLVIQSALVRTRPRPTQAVVLPPATLVSATEPTREQSIITVALVTTRPRPTHTLLRSPVVEPSLLGSDSRLTIQSALVRIRPRRTSGVIRPPLSVVAFEPTLSQQTLQIHLVRIRPRLTRARVVAPVVVETRLVPGDPRLVIKRALVRIRPVPPHTVLSKPTVLQVFQAAAVRLASRTRFEVGRRAPHFKLSPPTVLEVFRGPLTVLANRTKVERVRRAYRSILRRPIFREPTADQATIRTQLVQRTPVARLASYPQLREPAVVGEPIVVVAIAGTANVHDSGTFDAVVRDAPLYDANVDDQPAFEASVDDALDF